MSYTLDDLYPDWQLDAHCRGVGVNYYFGDDGDQPTMSIQQVRRASKLCDVCPVFIQCLTHALTTREEYGVWAGTSGRVRRRIFKMMDNGETTVTEVVEVFRSGQGDRYRLPTTEGRTTRYLQVEGQERDTRAGAAVLPDADRGQVAL